MNIKTKKVIDFYLGSFLIFSFRPLVSLVGNLLGRDHSPRVRGNIAIIKLLGGGSLVIAFPAILGIKQRYPESRLILVTTPSVRPFAELLTVFDQIIVINDANIFSIIFTGLRAWWTCLLIDTVIDLEVYSKLSTVLSLFTLARNRIGFYMEDIFWRKHISTHLIYFNRFSGAYKFYDQVTFLVDATPKDIDTCRAHMAKNLKASPHKSDVATICVGFACSEFGKERMLSGPQWNLFCHRKLPAGKKARLMFLGGSSDRQIGDEIIAKIEKSLSLREIQNCAGTMTLK